MIVQLRSNLLKFNLLMKKGWVQMIRYANSHFHLTINRAIIFMSLYRKLTRSCSPCLLTIIGGSLVSIISLSTLLLKRRKYRPQVWDVWSNACLSIFLLEFEFGCEQPRRGWGAESPVIYSTCSERKKERRKYLH